MSEIPAVCSVCCYALQGVVCTVFMKTYNYNRHSIKQRENSNFVLRIMNNKVRVLVEVKRLACNLLPGKANIFIFILASYTKKNEGLSQAWRHTPQCGLSEVTDKNRSSDAGT